jgi:ATP/maltotriose-dependent transcriptional regulator MalT
LYEESLFYYQDLNDKGGTATVYEGLGQLALQTGKLNTAAQHFRQALIVAQEIHYIPLLLSIVTDIGALLARANKAERSTPLFQMVLNHPASNQHQREEARSHLENTSEGMGTDADMPDLDVIVVTLEAELLAIADIDPQSVEQPLLDPLTPRELEVLQLIGKGLSNPAIAEHLFLSVGTVKAHTSRIYSKLGVQNRVQAVTLARELSLLQD